MPVNVSGGDLQWDAGIDLSKFNSDLQQIRNGLNSLTDLQKKQGSDLEAFAKKAAQAAAGYFSIQAAKDFVVSMVQVRGEFQQIEVAYRTMLGSKEKADKLMAESVKLAAVTPFTLQDVASGSKQLLAYGFAAEDITKNLETLGNIASGVGSQLNDVVYLYGTLKASGRVTQMDINQFAGRGIPIYKALADVMKINVDQVREYVSAGKVGFPDVEAAFKNLTSAGGQFYNLMQEQSKTLTGQLSNLEDAWSRMLNELGKSNEGLFADTIGGAIALIDNYQKIIDIIQVLIITYGAYRAALLINTAVVSGMSAAELIHYGALVAKDKMVKILTGSMGGLTAASAAYASILTALGIIVYAFVQYQNAAEIAEESLTKAREKGNSAMESEKKKNDELIAVIKNHNATKAEQIAAYNSLKSTTGDVLKKFTLEEVAAGKADNALKAYRNTVRDTISAEVEYSNYKGIEEKLKAIEEGGLKAISNMDRVRTSLARTFIPSSQGLGFNQWIKELFSKSAATEGIVGAETKKLKDAQQAILKGVNGKGVQNLLNGGKAVTSAEDDAALAKAKKYAADMKDVIGNFNNLIAGASSKADISKIKEGVQSAIDALAPGDSKIKAYQEKLKRVSEIEAQYGLGSGKAADKANKELFNWGEKKLEILNKINEAEAKVAAESMSQNDKEVADNKAKYKALRDELEKYNREALAAGKPTLGKEIFARVDNAEAKEKYEIVYKQQTASMLSELDKQKTYYEEFEEYKLQFGIEKAKEKFANDINLNKTYQQVIEEQLGRLLIKDPTQMTGAEKSALEAVKKLNDEAIKVENQKYQSLLSSLRTYEETRKNMVASYEENRSKLVAKGESNAVTVLDQIHKEALGNLDDQNVQKLSSFKELFEGIDRLSDKAAVRVIANGKAMLSALISKGLISKELGKQIGEKLTDTTRALDERLPTRLRAISGELQTMASLTGDVNKGFGSWLSSLGGIVGGIGQAKSLVNDITNLKSGDVLGAVSAGLSAANLIFSIGKSLENLFNSGARERAEQNAYESDLQAKQNAAVIKALDRQLQLINQVYGTEKLTKYAEAVKAIGSATDDVSKQLTAMYKLTGDKAFDDIITKINNGEQISPLSSNASFIANNQAYFDKLKINVNDLTELQRLLDSGRLDSKTATLAQSLIDLKQKAVDAANGIKEALTGTSFESFADSIVDLFASGNAAAADFTKNFEDLMKKAILNSFKTKTLATELQKFYDQFADLSASGSVLTQAEIATLKAQYDQIIKDGQTKFNQLQQVTGVNFANTGTSKNSLSGAYAAASQDSINILAGYTGAVKLELQKVNAFLASMGATMLQQLQVAKDSFALFIKIEANTLKIANNTDQLASIDYSLQFLAKNTNSNYNPLIAGSGAKLP